MKNAEPKQLEKIQGLVNAVRFTKMQHDKAIAEYNLALEELRIACGAPSNYQLGMDGIWSAPKDGNGAALGPAPARRSAPPTPVPAAAFFRRGRGRPRKR